MIDGANGDQVKLAEASDVLRRELELNPDNLSGLFQQARALQQRGLIDGALESYERYFAQKVSMDFAANYNAGELSELRGDFAKAEKYFQGCIGVAPQEWIGWERMILLLLKQQRTDDAKEYFQSLVKVAPGSDVVKRLAPKFPS
jgi:tetratricopeptide (TPR) repeat protein